MREPYGAPRPLQPGTRAVQFDAFATFRDFAKSKEYSDAAIEEAGKLLAGEYEKYLKDFANKGGIGFVNRSLFDVQVYSRNGGIARRWHLSFKVPKPYNCIFVTHPYPLNDSRLNAHGSLDVVNELLYGYDKRFDDVRARADVQKIRDSIDLRKPPAFGSFADNEALGLCTWLIQVSSQRFPLLSKALNPIGPQPDVAVIDDGGFRWVK